MGCEHFLRERRRTSEDALGKEGRNDGRLQQRQWRRDGNDVRNRVCGGPLYEVMVG
jgi:hypothetical protein